ncbi:S-layer homology domain-containing protein [Paenibacillus sp. PK3_47]|uniref:S-layer homology domain-containing protein n=1 Tax=Paenibacillus sp. PK3_47 TaxID=2072642 RepID=UPI00201E2405|nr:S-layer homology domain-containing protein [Paenibacillus sp. PK3_47]
MSDVHSSWASSQISKWLDRGLISGYADHTFKPDAQISRAEFASIVNKVFGFKDQAQTGFRDVSPDKWYYSAIGQAKSAGYISGFEDNTFRPEAAVSRQEAAKMLYMLLQLNGSANDSAIQKFKDYSAVPAWSKMYFNEIVNQGYINGYPDQTLRPLQKITRAEAVVILDKVMGTLVMDKGIFEGGGLTAIPGNVTVNTPDVTLKNITINGDLLLTAGIGSGEITLDQVTVTGRTLVAGGGENSVHLLNSRLNEVLVNKQPGRVRIAAEGSTQIHRTIVKTGVKLEAANKEAGFDSIELALTNADEPVDLSGTFNNITLKNKATVHVLGKSEIGALEVSAEAGASTINVADGSVLKQLTLNAAAEVKGKGTVSKAIINTGGSKFEQEIKDYALAKGVSVVVNGKVLTGEQETTKQLDPNILLPGAPAGGGSGGGGGGGGGGSNPGPVPQPETSELPDVQGVFMVEDQLYARFDEPGNYSGVQWNLINPDTETEYETAYQNAEGPVGVYAVKGGALPPAEYIAVISNAAYYDFLPALLLSNSVINGTYYPAVYYTGVLDISLQMNQNGILVNPDLATAAGTPLADGDLISVFYGDYLALKAKWNGSGKKWVYQGLVNILPAPENVSATPASKSDINLKWDAVPGAEYYNIFTSSTVEGIYSPIKDSSGTNIKVTGTSYTDGGQAPNTTVYYKVTAAANSTGSALSKQVSATTFANEHMQLDLDVTDSVQDPSKPVIYATDKQNKKLAAINYETRETAYVSFDLPPESLTYADGKLYVSLLKAEHSPYIFDEQQKGAVAVVDAATLTIDHIYDIDQDPYSIAADRQGYVYISSGSGQWTKIRSYSRETFAPAGSYTIGHATHILMHPAMDKLYTVNTLSIPRDIATFAIENGQFTSNYDSPYHGDYPLATNIHLSPDGKYLFNGAGTVFETTGDRFDDMSFVYEMDESYVAMTFDLQHGRFFTLNGKSVSSYDYSNFSKVGTMTVDGIGRQIYNGTSQLLALTRIGDSTVLEFVDKPLAEEVPPVDGPGIYLGGTVVDAVYDSANNKVYAVDQAFKNLVVVDTASQSVTQKITLPYKPAGLTLSEDGSKLYIVNKDASYLVTEVSLSDYQITRNMTYANWADSRDFSDRHIYSKSGRLYVVLGDSSPTLLVFDEATFQPSSGNREISGIGEMVFTGDSSSFYYWSQSGWDAGYAGSDVYNYSIHEDGSLTQSDMSNLGYPEFDRDPLDTPALLAESLGMIIVKNKAFNKGNLQEIIGTFPEPIYAVNVMNNTALGKKGIYDLKTFQKIGTVDLRGAKHIFYDDRGTLYYVLDNALFIN